LALVGLLVFVAGLALTPMAESDLFFRVQAGREILALHGLPGRNLYSFTYPEHPDLDAAWLFEVGAALLHGHGGFPALVVAKAAVLAATFAAAYALCRRRGAGPVASALALAGAAFAASDRFVERPHLFSFAGVVGVLAAIDVAAAGGLGTAFAACALAAVVLWANLHAGVFLAPALLALGAAGARLDRAGGAGRLAALAAGAALATLATPLGTGLVTYLRLNATLPELHPVDEFRAATWISDAPLLAFGVLAVASAVVVTVGARQARWRWLLPAAALGVLALRSVRFGPELALAAAPLVALALSRVGARFAATAAPSFATMLLLVALTLAPRLAAARAGGRLIDVSLDTRALPLEALRFVDDNGLRERMYNDFELGSYLLFEGWPRHRVFVDPRLPAYPAEFHALLGDPDLTRGQWDAALERYGVQSALLDYAGLNRRVAWFDPERWALVYRAHDARVFVRRAPRFAALIAAREIPATFSFTLTEGATTLPLDVQPSTSPVPPCEWQRRVGDLIVDLDGALSPRARAAYTRALTGPPGCLPSADDAKLAALMGALALSDDHPADALTLFDRARAHTPLDAPTSLNRAVALDRLARHEEAITAYEEVARRSDADAATRTQARARATALRPR
jgi:tetratricopeptide (TPR) repeat protein